MKYVLRFCKGGLLRFLSNQETATAIERMLRRAGLSLKFSGGYHPHPRLSYSAALATSIASAAVYVIVETQEKEERILLRVMQEGVSSLRLIDAWQVAETTSISDIIEGYNFRLMLPKEKFDTSLFSEHQRVTKRSKRGERVFSLSEAFQGFSVTKLNKYFMVEYSQHFDCLVPHEELLRVLGSGVEYSAERVYPFVDDGVLGNEKTSLFLNRLGGKQHVRSQ